MNRRPAARLPGPPLPTGTGRARQQGQVMPMTAILMVAVLLGIWVMYDSGQLMSERIRLQNTTDNVAYSSSALVARDLNFTAYTNRAMIANQVAIGQLVGLSSWAAMLEQMGNNLGVLGRLAGVVPGIGQAILVITQAIEKATDFLSRVIDTTANTVIYLNDAIGGALSESQRAHHVAISGALVEFSRQVGRANDPDAEPLFGGLAAPAQAYANWVRQVGRYGGDDASTWRDNTATRRVNDFARVINDSRDTFATARSYEMGFPMSGPPSFLNILPGFKVSWESRKRGGSDFGMTRKAGKRTSWDWTAMDTLGFKVKIEIDYIFGSDCIWCESIPLGWGAAHALESRGSYYNYKRGDGWGGAWGNRRAAYLAKRQHARHNLKSTGGLRDFYAFRDEEAAHTYGPALIFMFRKKAEALRLTADLGADGDNPLNTGAGDGFISAAAKARPWYARPTDLQQFARHDGNFEYGNLYNPFWQPRLVALSDPEKAALALAAGLSDP